MEEQKLKQEIENLKAELNLARVETENAKASGRLALARAEVAALTRKLYDNEAQKMINNAAQVSG